MLSKQFRRTLCRSYKDNDHTPDNWLAERLKTSQDLAAKAENGKVAVVYGGIDCDGGSWDNRVDIIPAHTMSLIQWEQDYWAGAEGRQWAEVHRPSAVTDLESTDRDLALEAFEDGHPHSWHY